MQRGRRGRRHDPLARRRRPERRGRRRRRDAGRGAAGRALRLPLPRRPGRARSGTTPTRRRRARCAAACTARSWSSRAKPRRPATGSTSPSSAHDARRARDARTASDGVEQRAVAPGTPVRLRLVNTDNTPQRFDLDGTPFRVVAIDGTDLNGPTPLERRDARARRRRPLRRRLHDAADARSRSRSPARPPALVLSPDGTADPPPPTGGPEFDPLAYGGPRADAVRRLEPLRPRASASTIGRKPGFLDGQPGDAVDDQRRHLPATCRCSSSSRRPRARSRSTNDTSAVHPMHLHGHHVLVLQPGRAARHRQPLVDGHARRRARASATRSPSARTTPGIWMDHCHNLEPRRRRA